MLPPSASSGSASDWPRFTGLSQLAWLPGALGAERGWFYSFVFTWNSPRNQMEHLSLYEPARLVALVHSPHDLPDGFLIICSPDLVGLTFPHLAPYSKALLYSMRPPCLCIRSLLGECSFHLLLSEKPTVSSGNTTSLSFREGCFVSALHTRGCPPYSTMCLNHRYRDRPYFRNRVGIAYAAQQRHPRCCCLPPPLFTKLTWHGLFGFILHTKHTVGVKMYLLNE